MAVPVLKLSTSSTRANPKTLAGLRVAVPAYVFVTPEPGITRVIFRIDSSAGRTETAAPWDFAGTASTGRALPYDFTRLAPGAHTITALVTRNGSSMTLTAPFTVVRPASSAAVPGITAPARSDVPVPEVATGTRITVTSPHVVTRTPYVQDMCYTATG